MRALNSPASPTIHKGCRDDRTLQLAEPVHDELLGIERHGIARTAHSHPNVVQYADGRPIAAEEVQPPSI